MTDATAELRAHHEASLAFNKWMLEDPNGFLDETSRAAIRQMLLKDQAALDEIDAGRLKATDEG